MIRKIISKLLVYRRRLLMVVRRLRYRLKNVDALAYIAPGVKPARDLVMEPYSFINIECLVGSGVQIGRYSMLGPRVMLVGNDHVIDKEGVPIIFSGRPEIKKTIIKEDAWIGAGAIIMAGVSIGRGAIVGAGSVVTKDVPDYEIHAGVPCRKIRERFEGDTLCRQHNEMLNGYLYVGEFCQRL